MPGHYPADLSVKAFMKELSEKQKQEQTEQREKLDKRRVSDDPAVLQSRFEDNLKHILSKTE